MEVKMFKIEHNVETDEVLQIELTEAEIEQREKEHQAAQAKLAEKNAEIDSILTAKIAAYVKLGLTEDEAKLLLS
jgi:hypothetical protein